MDPQCDISKEKMNSDTNVEASRQFRKKTSGWFLPESQNSGKTNYGYFPYIPDYTKWF